MGPRKRGQPQEPLDGSDEEDRSSSGQSSSKRARYEEEDTPDTTSGDEDIEDEELMNREVKRRMARIPAENVVADHGIVLALSCQNFMCHGNLKMEFGPFMNFVIGHNGSGKSAVLTALTLCLGGKATNTNRGGSMKSFIKEGEDTAEITVWLKNGGEGYRQDAYGDAIIVQRRFSSDGSSGYKLKSKTGKTISSKKEELDNITDFFGLQVDNPMTILTQDMARQFLSNSSNVDKYKFFNKGVQLEQLDKDYCLIWNCIKNTEQILETKKEAVSVLKVEVEKTKERLGQFQAQDGMRARKGELQLQMAWVQVRDKEMLLEDHDTLIESQRRRLARAEEYRDKASADYDSLDTDHEAAKARIEEELAKLAPFDDQKAQFKEEFEKNKDSLLSIVADERRARGEHKGLLSTIAEVKAKIEAEERRLADRNGGSTANLTLKIEEAKVKIARLKSEMQVLENQNTADRENLEEANKTVSQLQARESEKSYELRACQENLHQAKQAEGNVMQGFPKWMPSLLRAIDNEPGFRQKPVGPLGMYITLKEQKWMGIIEKFLGTTLTSFVVTNYADGDLLKRIMDRVGFRVPYTVTAPKQLNMNEPAENYLTILRVLDIENESARIQLVVSHSAEQAILIEDLDEANQIMRHRRHQDNIQMCFSINKNHAGYGHKVGGGIGVSSVAPVPPFNGLSHMKSVNAGAQIERFQYDVQRIQMELHEIEREKGAAKQRVAQIKQSMDDFDRRIRNFRLQISQNEDRIESLQSRIEEINADGELNVLQERLREAQERCEFTGQTCEDLSVNRLQLNAAQEALSKEMKGLDQDIALARQRLRAAEDEANRVNTGRHRLLVAKNRAVEKVVEVIAAIQQLEDERGPILDTVKDWEARASRICSRVPVGEGETSATMTRKLQQVCDQIAAAEKALGGSREETAAKYKLLGEQYEAGRNLCDSFDMLLREAMKVHNERRRRWKIFQNFISTRARAQFMFLTSHRAFKGRLRLEHTRRPPELIIEVQPGGESTGNRGPKTLSGGEKSFSTVCLLLALWEAMGSPVRCLDEFDVFMDSVNRSVSVDLMIEVAGRSTGKQFILITPQAMDKVSTINCRILRMSDPERGQTTITM